MKAEYSNLKQLAINVRKSLQRLSNTSLLKKVSYAFSPKHSSQMVNQSQKTALYYVNPMHQVGTQKATPITYDQERLTLKGNTLTQVGDVGGAQSKFKCNKTPQLFFKTGQEKEAKKAQFFKTVYESYGGPKENFKPPPETTFHDISNHRHTPESPLHNAAKKGLGLLEMENLTHNTKFSDITRSIDIKVFPAYDKHEFEANRNHSKSLPERAQLSVEEKMGFKYQDGTRFTKAFGAYQSKGSMRDLFDKLAHQMHLECSTPSTETLKDQLIDDFKQAANQASEFIQQTDFIPLGMSLMPVITATSNPDKPYQLSLTAIDPDHLMRSSTNSSEVGKTDENGIYVSDQGRFNTKRAKMAANLLYLANYVEQFHS